MTGSKHSREEGLSSNMERPGDLRQQLYLTHSGGIARDQWQEMG